MNTTSEASAPGGPLPSNLPRLAPGTVLRGRFTIERLVGRGLLGELYRAGDATDGKPVLIKLMPRELLPTAAVRSRLEQEIAIAAQLDHKNIAATYGFFVEGDTVFIAAEPVDGATLRQMLEKKLKGGRAFSLKGAYNVATHVCNALEYAHGALLHGVLSADTILVNAAGRVKVADFGLSRALAPQERFRALLGPAALACVAPEMIAAAESADRRADVYAVGAILFELLTGHSYDGSDVSAIVPGLPPALDEVIARCLNDAPAQRFADMGELKRALHGATDRVLNAAATPPLPSRPAPPSPPAALAAGGRPAPPPPPVGAGPGIAARPAAPNGFPPHLGAPRLPHGFSVASALSAVDDAHERWLIQKDKLDLGPFKLADVKEQIARGQIIGDHVIVDMENGERRRVREHPLLKDLMVVSEGKLEADRIAEQAATDAASHRRRVLTIIGVIGVLLVGAGTAFAFLVLPKLLAPKTETKIVYRDRDVDDIFKGIDISMKVEPPPAKGVKRGVRGAHAGGPGAKNAVGEFDSAMNLGDANSGGGDETLGADVVQRVMSQNVRSLGGCLIEERHRDASLHNVSMEFVIRGTGQVSAVKVNGATNTPFAACMLAKMQSVTFPKFNGAKTVASFTMALK